MTAVTIQSNKIVSNETIVVFTAIDYYSNSTEKKITDFLANAI